MVNTMTAVAMVNIDTSNMFSSINTTDQVPQALHRAYVFCVALGSDNLDKSGTDWTNYIILDEGAASAVAMLATAILREATIDRKYGPRSINKLLTEEMRDMLLTADETDEDDTAEGVMWDDSHPTERWDVY